MLFEIHLESQRKKKRKQKKRKFIFSTWFDGERWEFLSSSLHHRGIFDHLWIDSWTWAGKDWEKRQREKERKISVREGGMKFPLTSVPAAISWIAVIMMRGSPSTSHFRATQLGLHEWFMNLALFPQNDASTKRSFSSCDLKRKKKSVNSGRGERRNDYPLPWGRNDSFRLCCYYEHPIGLCRWSEIDKKYWNLHLE